MRHRLPILVFLLATLPIAGHAGAQIIVDDVEDLAPDRPEAWSMRYFTSISLLSGLGSPEALEPGSIELGFEGAWVPSLSEDERRVGFDGRKTEDLNKTSVFGRPRLLIGLPAKLSLTLSYTLPIESGGVEPNLFSAALGRPFWDGGAWRLGWRLYAQTGTVDGDFTCDRDTVAAGNDPVRNPFQCREISTDEVTMDYYGVELSAARGGAGAWEPHFAVALSELDTEFRVNAVYADFVDRTLLFADDTVLSLAAGLTYRAAERWRLVGEAFYAELGDISRRVAPASNVFVSDQTDLFHVRGMISYRLR